MANWEKLNKEFDDALNSMTKEDWKSWYERFKQKQINQNKMTAVEWLVEQLRQLAHNPNTHIGIGDVRVTQGYLDQLEEQAKEMEEQQKGYSKEEVIQLLIKMNSWPTTFDGEADISEWFEQFKSE